MGALLEKATLEKYKAGERVIEEGTRPKTLFNLAKGRVAVEIQRLNEATQLPESVKILTLYPGAVFGEMSFLTGEVSTALALLTPPLYCFLASPPHLPSLPLFPSHTLTIPRGGVRQRGRRARLRDQPDQGSQHRGDAHQRGRRIAGHLLLAPGYLPHGARQAAHGHGR